MFSIYICIYYVSKTHTQTHTDIYIYIYIYLYLYIYIYIYLYIYLYICVCVFIVCILCCVYVYVYNYEVLKTIIYIQIRFLLRSEMIVLRSLFDQRVFIAGMTISLTHVHMKSKSKVLNINI